MKRNSFAPERIYNGRSWFAVLDENGEPMPCDLVTWATWFRNRAQRTIRQETVKGFSVMTLFVGCMYWYKTVVIDPDGNVIWQRQTDSKPRAIAVHGKARALIENVK